MDPRIARAIAANVLAVGATVWYLKTRREERAKREIIKLNTEKEIARIRANADIVNERIAQGIYTRNRIAQLRTEEDVQNVIRNQE